MSTSIVVALDSSSTAESALPLARGLARRRKAPLILLSVVEVSVDFMAWVDSASVMMEDEVDEWISERTEYLNTIKDQTGDVEVQTAIRVGTPSNEIAGFVNEQDDPILVTTSHGRTGVDQIVFGSVAFKVIHEVYCPVVVVRIPEHVDPDRMYTKILIPVDGSEFSEAAIEEVISTVGEPKPEIHLVRVLDEPRWASRSFNHGLVSQYVSAAREEAGDHLQKLVTRLQEQGLAAEWHIRNGHDAEQICAAADELGVSEIGMATHGRGGLGRVFMGSTAQNILHRSRVPLILIPPAVK